MTERGLTPDDIATAADLARLPIVTGDDLAEDPSRFRSTKFPPGNALEVSTTGTSGRLKYVAHDDRGLLTAYAAGAREHRVIRALAGRGEHLRSLTIAPPQGTGLALESWWISRTLRPQRRGSAPTFLSVTTPAAEAVDVVNRVRPDIVRGFGSAIGYLYRWAAHHGREIWAPKVVVFGGDHLPERDRELLEHRLGVPVVSSYQACEALLIASQCELRQGLHVSADLVHLRVADNQGHDVPAGSEGAIVISNLVNRATVLLNYRLGDRGVMAGTPCPCGRTLPVLAQLSGRADDLLVRPDGERVHEGVVLKAIHSVPGVLEVQITQHAVNRVAVSLVAMPDHYAEPVALEVERALRDLLGDDPAINVTTTMVSSIPAIAGGKRRMVVSACSAED